MYVTRTRVQRALITRREIDNAYDRGIGTDGQWAAAFGSLGHQLARLDSDEVDQYRTVTGA
jgi:hypothetical protein